MVIDGKYLPDDDLVAKESNFIKKHNNIYITDEQNNVLKKYGIDIQKYKTMSELIYDIEICLNETKDNDDLSWVSQELSEYNYYNHTNK